MAVAVRALHPSTVLIMVLTANHRVNDAEAKNKSTMDPLDDGAVLLLVEDQIMDANQPIDTVLKDVGSADESHSVQDALLLINPSHRSRCFRSHGRRVWQGCCPRDGLGPCRYRGGCFRRSCRAG